MALEPKILPTPVGLICDLYCLLYFTSRYRLPPQGGVAGDRGTYHRRSAGLPTATARQEHAALHFQGVCFTLIWFLYFLKSDKSKHMQWQKIQKVCM